MLHIHLITSIHSSGRHTFVDFKPGFLGQILDTIAIKPLTQGKLSWHTSRSLVGVSVPFVVDAKLRTIEDVCRGQGPWRIRTGRTLLCFARAEKLDDGTRSTEQVEDEFSLYGLAIFDSAPIYEEDVERISRLVDGDRSRVSASLG